MSGEYDKPERGASQRARKVVLEAIGMKDYSPELPPSDNQPRQSPAEKPATIPQLQAAHESPVQRKRRKWLEEQKRQAQESGQALAELQAAIATWKTDKPPSTVASALRTARGRPRLKDDYTIIAELKEKGKTWKEISAAFEAKTRREKSSEACRALYARHKK